MKKILFILCVFLSFNSYCFARTCETRVLNSVEFIKEYEDNENESKAEFVLYNLDKSESFNLSEENNKYFLTFERIGRELGDESVSVYLKFLSEPQKQWLNSIQSYDDALAYYNTGNYSFNFDNRESFLESIRNSNGIYLIKTNYTIMVYIYTFAILEETQAPSEYEKVKYIVPLEVKLNIHTDNNMFLQLFGFSGFINYNYEPVNYCNTINNSAFLLEYNNDIDYNDYYQVVGSINDSNIISNNCNINFTVEDVLKYEENDYDIPLDRSCTAVIVNKKGLPILVAHGFLNNKPNIELDTESEVKYKLVIKNESNYPSNNNIIKSIIPTGITYVENSATHGGVFDMETNTVTWDIEHIDSNEEITLTYDVKINTNTNKTYEFLTTLGNDGNESIPSVTNKVKTNLFKNPKTGIIKQTIIVSILLIISIISYLIYSNKIIKSV